MLVEEVLEVSVETEHQLEEEMEVLGLSPQLLEHQNITPVVVEAVHTNLHQVVEVLEASVVVELVEQLDRIAAVCQGLQILVVAVVVHQPIPEGILVVELGALVLLF